MKFQKPAETIQIRGIDFRVNTDFRIWAEFATAIAKSKSNDEAADIIQQLIKKLALPQWPECFEAVLTFFLCGETEPKKSSLGTAKDRAYDFDVDEPLITADFRACYNIDLRTAELHWWDFIAMFKALPDSAIMSKIMGYRTIDLDKVDKKQRPMYRKLKQHYALDVKHYASLNDRNKALQEQMKKIQKRVNGNG